MVIPSLFPLAGQIQALNGFYPTGYKKWFITLSTVFSFFVYLYLQWFFESLAFYLSPWVAIVAALLLLLVYIFFLFAVLKKLQSLPRKQQGLAIAAGLLVYSLFSVSLTYAFNFLENENQYQILRGEITLHDGRPASNAEAAFHFTTTQRNPVRTVRADEKGRFLFVLARNQSEDLASVRIRWYQDNVLSEGLTVGKDRLTMQPLRLKLVPMEGQ